MKKRKKIQYLFLVCIIMTAFVFSGCGSKRQNEAPKGDNGSATQEADDTKKEPENSETEDFEISEGAKKTLELMTVCPNEELYNEETMTYPIGLTEEEVTEEQREAANQAAEESFEKWKGYIGEYYDEKGLESSRNNGVLYYYLSRNQNIELRELEVVEKTEKSERVRATVLVDGTAEETVFDFRRNDNGLIWTVEIENE